MKIDCKSFTCGALCLVGFSTLAWACIHRKAIAAAVKGEPLPEPPAWHVWHGACQK
jgi:hypothetical protein